MKEKEKKRMKKREEREGTIRRVLLFWTLCYHQGPWSINTICVYNLALVFVWVGQFVIMQVLQQLQTSSTYAAGKNTQVCKGK